MLVRNVLIKLISYLFVLICSYGDETGLGQRVRQDFVRFVCFRIVPNQVDARLVLVQRIQHHLRQKRTIRKVCY